jgi:RNA polymerase sigma-70 factor (ECF subfamily)
MENMLALSNQSISDAYTQYARSIFLYIYYKVEDEELAHDLVQDTFLRLISYRGKICFHTVKHLLFIIARNLVNDYLRRYYKAQEAASFLYENADSHLSIMQSV